jgi:hypothetical protein
VVAAETGGVKRKVACWATLVLAICSAANIIIGDLKFNRKWRLME